MKIVFLVSSLGAGGAERVATTLCNAWAARGDSVTLVPTFSCRGSTFYATDTKVNVKYLADLVSDNFFFKRNFSKNHLQRLWTLRRLIIDSKPDVVVAFLPNVNVAAILATSFTGIPCIVCERSDPLARSIGRFWTTACKIFYRFADAVTVQTESVAQRIESIYPNLRHIAVMPNPIPEALLNMQPKDYAQSGSSQRKTLISVGRLSAEKRPDQIIHAFTALAQKYPHWDLHLIGDGPMREELTRQIAASGLVPGRVKLMGRDPNPWAAMKKADAFIMASAYEGFPNALLEAVALGLPSISTDCRSGPREISDGGAAVFLVPPDSSEALVSGLDHFLANDALRHRLSIDGARSVRERYQLSAVLARWDSLFEYVLNTKGSTAKTEDRS